MNIPALSTALSQIDILREVNIALLQKNMDNMEVSNLNLLKSIETSVSPNIGQNVDIKL
ncbi:MAG TPA: putative motility protein [Clostridiales bacterium]|nr:putative motility protein [Clostridiales bacterium]